MLEMGAIRVNHDANLVLSSIYTVPKKDSGKRRPVINLRWVNGHLREQHFKMSTMRDVKAAITANCWMASVDLSDCFWGLPVHPKDQRFLSFRWRGVNYSFQVLPFGLSLSPYFITKLYHQVVEELQARGHRVIIYIDDIIILGDTKKECAASVEALVALLEELGAVINKEKSCLSPVQRIEYLGFTIDSAKMEISVPTKKMANLRKAIRSFRKKTHASARDAASVLGKINSIADAVYSSRVQTTALHQFKEKCLARGGWDSTLPLQDYRLALQDCDWWLDNLSDLNGRPLIPPEADLQAATDASDYGWGGWIRIPSGVILTCRGAFPRDQVLNHINWKELMAVNHLLHSMIQHLRGKVVDLGIDNTTALWYIKRMGGKRPDLARLASEIFKFMKMNQVRFLPYHLPGRLNELADRESRAREQITDAKLNHNIFRYLDTMWGPHTIDLFATHENKQLHRYASWAPQPGAVWVDSMAHSWQGLNAWINPPFSLLGKILQKIEQDKATATIIAPLWTGQPWFPRLLRLAVDTPVALPKQGLFQWPPSLLDPPPQPKWLTLAWRVCGDRSKRRAMKKARFRSRWTPSQDLQKQVTRRYGLSGSSSQRDAAKIRQFTTAPSFLGG